MRYIIAAPAFALVAGIALGFVVSRGLDGSASAAPPTQAVEEQNLDASGFIAVHEQGTANVAGTVDVGNLPAVQDGEHRLNSVAGRKAHRVGDTGNPSRRKLSVALRRRV